MENLNENVDVKTMDHIKKKLTINRKMIAVKLTYFAWGCANGTYGIYMNPFFINVGMSETRTGLLTGLTFAVSSVAGPVWGILSDYTGRQKLILTILCLVAAGSIASLPLVANTFVNPTNNPKVCEKKEVNNSLFSQGSSENALVNSSGNGTDNDLHCTPLFENESDSLFYHLLVIVIFGAIFFNPMQAFVEAIALNLIKATSGASYGGQRIFGSIGGCLSLYATGFIIDRYPLSGMSEFSMAFFLFAPYSLLLIPLASYLSVCKGKIDKELKKQNDEISLTQDANKSEPLSVTNQLFHMLQRLEIIMLLLTTLVAGLAFSLFIFFTTLLVEEKLHTSKKEASFIFILLTIVNTCTFPVTSIVIKLLRGPVPVIIIGILCHGARHIVMSYTTAYWLMLTIQLLHCFDFALFWCAMMEYMHELSPPAIKVTMTLILNSVKFQISPFLLNVVGGMIYQRYGGSILFRWNGVICCAWAAVLVLFYSLRFVGGTKRKNQSTEEEPMNGGQCVEEY